MSNLSSDVLLANIKDSFAYIMFETDGTIIEANKIFINTMEYTLEEIVGKKHAMFLSDEDRNAPEYKQFWLDLNKGITQEREFKRFTKSGKELMLKASYIPIKENGQVVKVVKLATEFTDKAKKIEEGFIFKKMMDESILPRMMSTPEGVMIYMNESCKNTLKRLEAYLPAPVEQLMGKSIDWFHKKPEHQRSVIGNPKNLPITTVIQVGPEKLELNITPVFYEGKYKYTNVTWNIVTGKLKLMEDLKNSSVELTNNANEVIAISTNLTRAAEETTAQANTASVASEEINAGVQTVANNMEQMVTAIKEITRTTNEASSMTNNAMKMASDTNKIITQLGQSSLDIGNVIKVISSIAQQTNLLALNATIEAARAGDAGRGFAVVANEVKELAKQTSKATEDITKKIEAIQNDSKNAVTAVSGISTAIEKVNGYTSNIAVAVEEQAATTSEVNRVIAEAAEGVTQITKNIISVTKAAESTGKSAGTATNAAGGLTNLAKKLNDLISQVQ